MPKLPVITAKEAERLLLEAGYVLVRVKGSHQICKKENNRIVLPFHAGKTLHPKIVRQVIIATKEE